LLLLNINAAPSFNLGVRYLFFKNTSFSSNIEPMSLPLSVYPCFSILVV